MNVQPAEERLALESPAFLISMLYGSATVRHHINAYCKHLAAITKGLFLAALQLNGTDIVGGTYAGPGYQLRQYYRYGNVSDCREFWEAFYNCLKKRTAFADKVRNVKSLYLNIGVCFLDNSRNHLVCSCLQQSCLPHYREHWPMPVCSCQVPEKDPMHHPMWKLRTKEEAKDAWEREFGHLTEEAGTAKAQPQRRHQTGFVASHNTYQSPALAKAAAAVAGHPPTPEQARMRPTVEEEGGTSR